jgi:hypothetical protein
MPVRMPRRRNSEGLAVSTRPHVLMVLMLKAITLVVRGGPTTLHQVRRR